MAGIWMSILCLTAGCFPNFMGNSSKGADKNGSPQHYSSDSKRTVKMVKAAFQGGEAVIELNDDALVEGLVASMPITLQFHDRGDGTKVGYFSADLFKGKQVEGIKPEAGDIVVNVRTGEAVVYCREGEFSPDLLFMGRVVSGIQDLETAQGDFEIYLWKIKK
jgi:hypothetical protein